MSVFMADRGDKLANAYVAVDNAIVYGVNKGVKAWNWATGRTKADLANLLLYGSAFLIAGGGITLSSQEKNPYGGIVFSAVAALVSAVSINKNRKTEKKEMGESRRRESIEDAEIELHKENISWFGPLFGATGASIGSIAYSRLDNSADYKKNVGGLLLGGGFMALSGSYYVMRADNVRPRKNCIARGLEKLM
jgi:hypothetical protein